MANVPRRRTGDARYFPELPQMTNVTLQNDFLRDSHFDHQHSVKVSGPPLLIYSVLSDIIG